MMNSMGGIVAFPFRSSWENVDLDIHVVILIDEEGWDIECGPLNTRDKKYAKG